MEFFFGSNISCCLKTGNILFVLEQKFAPKKLDFQHFLVIEKFKLVMEKFYCPISV